MKSNLQITKSFLTLVAGISSISIPVIAQAQQITLEEIVVTARQRSESLQEIPLAISAFSAADIKKADIRVFEDISRKTPGIYFNAISTEHANGRTGTNVRIRGVSAAESASLFIDGVFALDGVDAIPVHDIERVEVIRGPQSAFFGRNTFAGAINYVTKNPSLEEYEGTIDFSAATYEQFDVSVTHSGPLLEGKLGYLLSTRLHSDGGMYRASDGGALGKESTNSVSGVLYAEPSEKLSMKLRAFYQELDDGPAPTATTYGALYGTPGYPDCFGQQVSAPDVGSIAFPGHFLCGSVPNPGEVGAPVVDINTSLRPVILGQVRPAFDGEANVFLPPAARPDFVIERLINDSIVASGPRLDGLGTRRNTIRLSFNTNYSFENGYEAVLTAGWNDSKQNNLVDYDQTSIESWYVQANTTREDYSLDGRIVSPGEDQFRWLLGGTYYHQDFVSAGFGRAVATCFLSCATGPAVLAAAPNAGNVAKVWGIYGSISYDITEQLTLDIEGRYLQDKRKTGLNAGTFEQSVSDKFKQETPRVILTYRPSDETTLYAQGSKGSLPGVTNGIVSICSEEEFLVPYVPSFGPNVGQPSTASECDQMRAALGGELITASPSQYLEALEMGWKQTALDSALSWNLTGYYYWWRNRPSSRLVQYFRDDNDPNLRDRIPNASPVTQGLTISGSEKLWGLEFEAAYSLENWDFSGHLSWNRSQITDSVSTSYNLVYGFSDYRGRERIQYPKWVGGLSGTYTSDTFSGDWRWYARSDLFYQGRQFIDRGNFATIDPSILVDARIGTLNEEMRLELFVKNLFQQRNWKAGSTDSDVTTPGNLVFYANLASGLLPQDKRTIGLRANYSF